MPDLPDESRSSDEQSLWERYARGLPAPAACPPVIDLAAWLDGGAGAGPEAVETHLAECGVCREAVAGIRLERAEVAGRVVVAPAGVLAAAKMLVETRRGPAASRRGLRLADWLAPAIGPGRWGMAAAASIAICFVGYRVGSGRPMLDTVTTDDLLLAEMSFGLLNGGDDGLLIAFDEVTR